MSIYPGEGKVLIERYSLNNLSKCVVVRVLMYTNKLWKSYFKIGEVQAENNTIEKSVNFKEYN